MAVHHKIGSITDIHNPPGSSNKHGYGSLVYIGYTDMHKDEYYVVKVPQTVSIIEPDGEVEIEDVPLGYRDKKYADITRIRAIAMTDDRLCWVDDIQFSQDRPFFKSIVDLF